MGILVQSVVYKKCGNLVLQLIVEPYVSAPEILKPIYATKFSI